MATIKSITATTINIQTQYGEAVVAKIKKLGAKWNAAEKVWTLPVAKLDAVKKLGIAESAKKMSETDKNRINDILVRVANTDRRVVQFRSGKTNLDDASLEGNNLIVNLPEKVTNVIYPQVNAVLRVEFGDWFTPAKTAERIFREYVTGDISDAEEAAAAGLVNFRDGEYEDVETGGGEERRYAYIKEIVSYAESLTQETQAKADAKSHLLAARKELDSIYSSGKGHQEYLVRKIAKAEELIARFPLAAEMLNTEISAMKADNRQ